MTQPPVSILVSVSKVQAEQEGPRKAPERSGGHHGDSQRGGPDDQALGRRDQGRQGLLGPGRLLFADGRGPEEAAEGLGI